MRRRIRPWRIDVGVRDTTIRWVAVSLLFVAFGVNALSMRHTENELKQNAITGCYGSTTRQVNQLTFDWTVYKADLSAGHTNGVRAREAVNLLANMEAIAAVRISVTVASLLPAPLAAVVRRVDFHCP